MVDIDRMASETGYVDEQTKVAQSAELVMFKLYGVSKNAPTLASCNFNKYRLILITFGKQHQHSFKHNTHI